MIIAKVDWLENIFQFLMPKNIIGYSSTTIFYRFDKTNFISFLSFATGISQQ